MNYNWNWRIFWQPAPDGQGTYLHSLIVGLGWTLATALAAWVIALAARLGPRHAAHHTVEVGGAAGQRATSSCSATSRCSCRCSCGSSCCPSCCRAALGDVDQADAAALGRVHPRGAVPGLLHRGARRRAGARRHPVAAARPGHGRHRARPHAAADLPLRAAADGVPHHPAAADVRVHERHQELVGRADDRPRRAHRPRRGRCRSSASRCSRRSPRRR